MADEDTINLINMIVSLCILAFMLATAFGVTIWLFFRWRGAMKDARIFYSIVTEMAPSIAFADLSGGNAVTYEAIVKTLGADENRGQLKDKNIPTMLITVSIDDYMKLRLGHEIAYGGPPSKKIHYEDAPLRYAEVQKAISQDKALVNSTGEEGARVRRLTQEVTSESDF